MKIYYSGTSREIPVADSSYRYRVIMGENSLTLKFSLTEFIDIPVGAYCEFQGETYTLTRPENFTKKSARDIEYTLVLDSEIAKIEKYKFRDPISHRLKFSLTAKPQEHIQMLVDNLNMRDGGWTVGNHIEATEKTVSYNHTFCSDALRMMAEAFDTEWEVSGKTIHLKKLEYNKATPLSLSYGRGNGFKPGLGRTNFDNNKPIEILFVQGGERNIDMSKYGAPELLLPKNQQLAYEGRQYTTDAEGLFICRADKAIVTHEEDSLDLTNIYPSRIGTTSSLVVVDEAKNLYDFTDATIPEELNFDSCLEAGETMTVIFQTGMLVGRELEAKYIHADRRFELVPQEIDGVTMPNAQFKPVPGDKYVVFGISLPDAYVCNNATQTGASWDMFREAAKYLYENEDPRFSFTGEMDGIWSKKNWLEIGGKIKLGGFVSFSDTQFQTAGVLIRIAGIKDSINSPYSPTIELSNVTTGLTVSSDLRKISSNEVVTFDLHREAIQYTKRRFRDAQETAAMLGDALLNFTEGISPITVKTMQLLVGDESLQFQFVNNKANPQRVPHVVAFNPATKVLTSAAGILQHMTIGISSITSTHQASEFKYWDMETYATAPITDPKGGYLYAKVSKTATTGVFLLSQTAIAMESMAGYYHLLVGILNSEYENDRSFVEMYGFTEITPGRITTDKVVSADGQNFLDFVNNAFRVGNANTSLDFNTQGDGKLRLKGTIIQSLSGDESMLGAFRGAYNATYTYYTGDQVTHSGSTWRFISINPVAGSTPAEGATWTKVAAVGDVGPIGPIGPTGNTGSQGNTGATGNYTEYKYAKNGSTTVPPTISTSSLNPSGWLAAPPTTVALEYLWMTTAVKNGAGSALISNWTTPTIIKGADGATGVAGAAGATGANGAQGVQGPIGPAPAYQGAYSAGVTYYGTGARVDIVKYSSVYYVARSDAGTFSGKVPTNTAYWNAFGAQFESVATNLLFASLAYIENLGVKYLRTGISPNARIEINEASNAINVFDSANAMVVNIDDTAGQDEITGTQYPGIEIRKGTVSKVSSVGIFTNGPGMQCVPASMGITAKAAIAALANGANSDSYGFVAGLYGKAANSGSAPAFAAYHDGNVKTVGVHQLHSVAFNPEAVNQPSNSATVYLQAPYKVFIGDLKAQNSTWYLPSAASYKQWECIHIACYNDNDIYLKAYPGQLINGYTEAQKYITMYDASCNAVLMSNGSNNWIILTLSGTSIAF